MTLIGSIVAWWRNGTAYVADRRVPFASATSPTEWIALPSPVSSNAPKRAAIVSLVTCVRGPDENCGFNAARPVRAAQ